MSKLLLIAVLLIVSQSTIDRRYPDAIRCGADNSCCDGAIFMVHAAQQTKLAHYCQVLGAEDRCVAFNADGYYTGVGHYDSRKGC